MPLLFTFLAYEFISTLIIVFRSTTLLTLFTFLPFLFYIASFNFLFPLYRFFYPSAYPLLFTSTSIPQHSASLFLPKSFIFSSSPFLSCLCLSCLSPSAKSRGRGRGHKRGHRERKRSGSERCFFAPVFVPTNPASFFGFLSSLESTKLCL